MKTDGLWEIRDCVVWLGSELEPTHCNRLVWGDGKIQAIEVVGLATEVGTARFAILPGLVNAHTHVGDSFLADAATELTLEKAFFRPDGYKYRALRDVPAPAHIAAMTEFLGGMAATGTVAHVDFREQGLEGCRRLREASRRTGVRSIILSQLDGVPYTEDQLKHNALPLPGSARAELEAILAEADGFSESTMNDLTGAAWRDIREMTTTHGRARAIHCLENDGYRTLSLSRCGKPDLIRALELLDPDLIVHLTVANASEVEAVAASGKTVVINARANAALGLPLPPVAALLQAGVNVTVGTDNGMLNGPNLLAELDFVFRLARSQGGEGWRPNPVDILKMATVNFGRTRWGKEFPGTLSPGGVATFTVIDLQAPHLRHSRNLTASIITRTSPGDIRQTVRAGEILYQQDGFTSDVYR